MLTINTINNQQKSVISGFKFFLLYIIVIWNVLLNFLAHQKHGSVAKNHYRRKVTKIIVTVTQMMFHRGQNEKNPEKKKSNPKVKCKI